MPPEALRGPRILLRRFTIADAPRVHAIQSNRNVARMLRMAAWPADLGDITAWLAGHAAEWNGGAAYRFAVELEGRVIGCADVDEIADGAGELGYWFDEDAWGHGYATEAAVLVMGFAFGSLGLRRLASGHAADNPASGRVLRRLCFEPAGEALRWSRSRGGEVLQRLYCRDA